MAAEMTRLFNVNDPQMLATAVYFADQLEDHYFNKFAEYYPSVFNEHYIPSFREAIQKVHDIPTDDVQIDIQAKETNDVNVAMKQCMREIRFAVGFVDPAFEDGGFTKNQMGYNNLRSIRKNSIELTHFMESFLKQINKHINALLPHYYPENKPSHLQFLLNQLRKETKEQREAIADRTRFANERVHAMNHLWERMAFIVKMK